MSDGNVLAMSDQAWSLVESGRLEEARSLFKNICEMDGHDPESWMMLGSLHAEFSDIQDAISCLEKSIELDPAYPDAHLNLAKVLVQQNLPEKAITHCTIAVNNDPSYGDAWQLLGRVQERLGKFAEAEASSRRAIEFAPENAPGHANLALALWKQNKLPEAVDSYQRALQLDSRLVVAWMQLAAVNCHMGAYSEAERCYRKVIEIEPERGEAYGQLGDLFIKQKRIDEGIDAFCKALQIKSDDAGVYLQLGWAFQGKKQWADAIGAFQRAFELAPDNVNACFGLAAAYLEKGMREEAIEHFHLALSRDPDNEQIQFHIAQLTGTSLPNAPPTEYVRKLFDEYAERFDSHLVGELSYKAPELIHAAVVEVSGVSKRMDILDLGCGTGLCALLFKEQALRLSGIDLSEKMVEAARRRDIYDHLVVGDIAIALEGQNEVHDLIIAADVFVYVGDLKRVFELSALAIKKTGLFAFTVEAAKNETVDFFLEPSSGRYSHSQQYLIGLARDFGFEVVMLRNGVLRTDRGSPINGYIVVMRRP